MQNRPVGRAPNYTNAALVMGLVNLLWVFMAIWALFGFAWVVLAALVLNRLIARLEPHRTQDA